MAHEPTFTTTEFLLKRSNCPRRVWEHEGLRCSRTHKCQACAAGVATSPHLAETPCKLAKAVSNRIKQSKFHSSSSFWSQSSPGRLTHDNDGFRNYDSEAVIPTNTAGFQNYDSKTTLYTIYHMFTEIDYYSKTRP